MIELQEMPFSEAKRLMLKRLLSDSRFKPIWTDEPKLGTYDRLYSIEAINAHAGRKLIDIKLWIPLLSDLNMQDTAMVEIQNLIERDLISVDANFRK